MSEWVDILITYDETEAAIVKDVLEAEDIQVVVESMKITPYPVSIGRMGEVRVKVKSSEKERAERVLKIMKEEAESGESTDDC